MSIPLSARTPDANTVIYMALVSPAMPRRSQSQLALGAIYLLAFRP
jgi:hypothetical protein